MMRIGFWCIKRQIREVRVPQPHPALIEVAAGRAIGSREGGEIESIWRSALQHRMNGLLWSRVLAGELIVSDDGRRRLSATDEAQRLWHENLRSTLADILAECSAHGLELIAFKGVTSTARWYSRDGERPCVDLDLLVPPSGLRRVADYVRVIQPAHPLEPHVQELVRRGVLQALKLTTPAQVDIDLHFDLLKYEAPTRQPGVVANRAIRMQLPGGTEVQVLDPEIALVQLLLELNKDRFRYLLGYADVARILAQEDLDWCFIDQFLTQEGIEEPVLLSLNAVVETLGLPAPDVKMPTGWRAAIWHRLWGPGLRLEGSEGAAKHGNLQRLIPMLAHGRFREGLVALWRYTFPPRVLAESYFGVTPGGYIGMVTLGRLRNELRRRRAMN
jgi:putative nucleotidyltransferase-like protein